MFLAHVGPRGRALVDKRLYLPESWTSDPARCATAGVPEAQRRYRAKTGLALEMLRQARARGCLSAGWAAGDDAFGMSPGFRDGLTAEGMQYVLDVPPDTPVWPLEPTWSRLAYHGRGRPPQLKPRHQERLSVAERSLAQPKEAWREVTVAEGAQGPRTYRFSAERIRETRNREPGGVLWAVYRQNLDGSQPRYYFSNAPEDTPLETLAAWEGHGGLLRPSSRPRRATWGWMSTRRGHGLGGITTSPCACWPGAFLLSLQQDWGGKDAPDHASPGVPGGAGDVAPGAVRAG